MRLASSDEIASASARLTLGQLPLTGYRDEMLSQPFAGRSLRNYGILTEYAEVVSRLGLSEDELFWSRYYWLARFAREWQSALGYDAGLEQQVFQLLESVEHVPTTFDPLSEVKAAVERDAVILDETFEVTGGARVGWANATWPFAKLTATFDSLRVAVGVLGDYTFTPDTVVSITRYTEIPILGWGIQIQHCVPEYPARFIFWCAGSPDSLLAGIRESGFEPRALITAMPQRQGFALRWQAIVVAIVAWNGPFILERYLQQRASPFPGLLTIFGLGLVLAATVATMKWPVFQRLVLKPGRSVGEVRSFLNLILLVSSLLFVVFLLVALFKP